MAVISKFIVNIYERTFEDSPFDEEVSKVIVFDLPSNYDFSALQSYLESREAFDITHSYYTLDKNGSVKLIVSRFSEMFKIRYWILHPTSILKVFYYYKDII